MNHDRAVRAIRPAHAAAPVGGVAAAVIEQTDAPVSGGAAHRASDGGGPVAIIARVRT